MSDAKVINEVLDALAAQGELKEVEPPRVKARAYMAVADAVDAYRAAGSPRVPDVPDDITLQWAADFLEENARMAGEVECVDSLSSKPHEFGNHALSEFKERFTVMASFLRSLRGSK